jgi:hypothetical protein
MEGRGRTKEGEGAKGSRKVERTRREVEDEGGKEGGEDAGGEGRQRSAENSVRRGAGGAGGWRETKRGTGEGK